MASLTAWMLDVRSEAERTRRRSAALRARTERSRDEAHLRRADLLVLYARLRQRQRIKVPSAWSELSWELPGHELERVLDVLDGSATRRARG